MPHLSLVLFYINLVAEDDEREVLRVMRARLNKELIPPAVKCLERLGAIHVVHEYAAVCTSIERDAKRLEALLTRGVPQLGADARRCVSMSWQQRDRRNCERLAPA